MKFSIVTITHNRAHLIGETIQSVLNQTYADFEHIIIDDGSTDETESVVKQFNDNRIRYLKYEKNDRRSFVTNQGLRMAKGDFICVLDSDDIWTNDKLKTINSILNENSAVDFVIHNIDFFPKKNNTTIAFPEYQTDFSGYVLNDLLDGKILAFSTYTIRNKSLKQIDFLDELMIDGKLDLYIRAASKFQFYYSAKKLTLVRKHNQNISKNYLMSHYEDYIKSIYKLLINGVISNKKYRFLISRIYSKIAYIYHKQKKNSKAKENYIKSFQAAFFSYPGFKSFLMYLKTSFLTNE